MAAVHRRDLERPRPRAADHRVSARRRDPRRLRSSKARSQGNVRRARRVPPGVLRADANQACRRATAASSAIVRTITSSTSASKCRRPSGCRTSGWARVGFSTNSHTEHFGSDAALQDPGPSTTWPNIDGGAFVTGTTGSGKSEIYLILPRYQITASGLYQFPCGINVAANLVAREGYGMPFFEPVESADPLLPEKRVLLVDPRRAACLRRRRWTCAARSRSCSAAASWCCRSISSTCSIRRRCWAASTTSPPREHRLQPAARNHESAAAAFRRAVPVLVVTARAATRRSRRTLDRTVRRRGPPRIFRPRMFRITAAQFLSHFRIGALPETLQILRRLHRPSVRREEVKGDRRLRSGRSAVSRRGRTVPAASLTR